MEEISLLGKYQYSLITLMEINLENIMRIIVQNSSILIEKQMQMEQLSKKESHTEYCKSVIQHIMMEN
jgi:hypothetical protein